jgi:2-keto-3-deoxy-6-phosphogluconate aldolase
MDKLSAHRMRGPLIAVLGRISPEEAIALAPAASYGTNAFAVIVAEKPEDFAPVLETLRQGGWRAVAVPASVGAAAAWGSFDQDVPLPAPAGDASRGAGVVR